MRSQRPDDHSKKYPVPTSSHCTKRTHGSHARVRVEDLLNHTSSRCLHHALAHGRTSMPLEKWWFDRVGVGGSHKKTSPVCFWWDFNWSKDAGRGGLVHFEEIFYHYSPGNSQMTELQIWSPAAPTCPGHMVCSNLCKHPISWKCIGIKKKQGSLNLGWITLLAL